MMRAVFATVCRRCPGLVLALLLAGLTGCASHPPFEGEVTVFHAFESGTANTDVQSYAFMEPRKGDDSLELRRYQDLVRRQLDARGFREVPMARAYMAVLLHYEVDNGKELISTSPVYGQISAGFYSRHDRLWVAPSYGITGTQFNSRVIYTRVLQVDLLKAADLDKDQPGRLFEGRVVSQGETAEMNTVMPYMVKALFTGFPGNSGKTRTVFCEPKDAVIQCSDGPKQ